MYYSIKRELTHANVLHLVCNHNSPHVIHLDKVWSINSKPDGEYSRMAFYATSINPLVINVKIDDAEKIIERFSGLK